MNAMGIFCCCCFGLGLFFLASRAFGATVANGLKVLINSSYFLNVSHVGCASVAAVLLDAVGARYLLV